MDRVSNALTAIKDASASGASSVGEFFSSTAESGVTAFKGTSLGESFFKNIGAILVVVMILLGGIIYIDLASSGGGGGAGAGAGAGGGGATCRMRWSAWNFHLPFGKSTSTMPSAT